MAGIFERNPNHTTYEVDLDDSRFVMITDVEPEARDPIVVLNWFEELLKRVGR